MSGLPRHRIGLVTKLREEGRHEDALLIENGAGFSLYTGDDALTSCLQEHLRDVVLLGFLTGWRRRGN